MSKYIRTEKGRIVTPIGFDPVKGVEIYDSNEFKQGDDALKTADKIEDLCDERVLSRYFPNTNITIYGLLPESEWDMMTKSVSERLKNGVTDCNLYGAIWTDKGLIYVAKMNAKGELELI